jgi:hypothetical protein
MKFHLLMGACFLQKNGRETLFSIYICFGMGGQVPKACLKRCLCEHVSHHSACAVHEKEKNTHHTTLEVNGMASEGKMIE